MSKDTRFSTTMTDVNGPRKFMVLNYFITLANTTFSVSFSFSFSF
jgi:hypothetical protein